VKGLALVGLVLLMLFVFAAAGAIVGVVVGAGDPIDAAWAAGITATIVQFFVGAVFFAEGRR
jgi:hypothetical protein